MSAAQLDLFGNRGVADPSRRPTPDSRLPNRLYAVGLPREVPVIVHTNRRVLVSLSVRGALRVHAGYVSAPNEVLAAIIRWARPNTRRADRLAAQRVLLAFPVQDHAPLTARPPERLSALPRPGDARLFARLHQLHARLNRRHFGGTLARVRMALSTRMRRRLGEFRLSADGIHEIVIARRHLRRDGWRGVIETLAHEMIHQWQAETGRRLGHGAEFRRQWEDLRNSGLGSLPATPESRIPSPKSRSGYPADIFLRLLPET